ncbi:hypothetical protein ACFYWN_03255 [Streptomyces sp. NPDC002917]|uniref:hypothetical protein n=1 Tax=unclassified Streptomyces TaxID=2593676 RepID=UPI0036784E0C
MAPFLGALLSRSPDPSLPTLRQVVGRDARRPAGTTIPGSVHFAGSAFRGFVMETVLPESALRGRAAGVGFRTVPGPWTIAAMSQESIRNYLASVEGRLAADGCGPCWEDWAGIEKGVRYFQPQS